jgi:hypothetical protein
MNRSWRLAVVTAALALASAGCTTVIRSSAPAPGGAAGGQPLVSQTVSNDGRFTAFLAAAAVPGDTNNDADVFRHDNLTGRTTRVSLRDDGAQIPGGSGGLAISGNGDQVAFWTNVSLEPADTNGIIDVYVRTVSTETTERVSIKPDGSPIFVSDRGQGLRRVSLSDDGRLALVMETEPTGGHAYLRDLVANTTVELSDHSTDAILAGNGQWIVQNDACSGGPCPFTANLVSTSGGATEPIAPSCGFEAYDVSADARYVVGRRFGVFPTFECPAPTGIVRWDRTTKQLTPVGLDTTTIAGVTISNDGRFVAVLSSTDEVLRVADLQTGVIQVADGDWLGRRDSTPTAQGTISGNGRYVVLGTAARLSPDDDGDSPDVLTHYSISPGVTSAAPASVARGASHVTVRVNGTELLPGATVAFPNGGITVHSVTVVNPTRLDVDLSVAPDVPVGPALTIVTNTGAVGGANAVCGCLTVS